MILELLQEMNEVMGGAGSVNERRDKLTRIEAKIHDLRFRDRDAYGKPKLPPKEFLALIDAVHYYKKALRWEYSLRD